jgi:type VI secretion system protein ImpH
MAGARRLEAAPMTIDPKLLGRLLDAPTTYDFFQAVHLLERLLSERDPVGGFADPADEVVRFSTPTTVSFPASAIQSLAPPTDETPARMTVNFFGLTGPQGVMPLDYSLYLGQRGRMGDHALNAFLGIFEHRIISLFYRAWAKSHAAVGVEGRDAPEGAVAEATSEDWLTRHLLSLVGLGAPSLQHRLPMPDTSLLYYSGLLNMPSRPAAALEQIVADFFDVPVQVEQFVGAWYPLDESAQTALGSDSVIPSGLGGGAVAGDEVWDQQGRVRLRIGPLTRVRYEEFLPGGAAHTALRGLTRFFSNDQLDFEIQLVLARDEAPPCRLDADATPLPLGWCTWLRTAPMDRDPDDALFTL